MRAWVAAGLGKGSVPFSMGALDSMMAGLDCGVPSLVAWPIVRDCFDLFLAIEDRWAVEAMRAAAREGVVLGESGAAGLAGLLALVRQPALAGAREHLKLGPSTRVLLIGTEGDTDPAHYREVVGRPAEDVATLREERSGAPSR